MWKSLGSNINEKSASRVANTLEMMEKIMASIDDDCSYSKRSGKRNISSENEAVNQIAMDLMNKNTFHYTPGRKGHSSFSKFSGNLFEGIDYRDLHKWMKEYIELWASIYEK